nr:transposase [Candidatus Nitrospira neomarina]
MPQYRRARIPGGTYFFTVVTYHRQSLLENPLCQDILWTVIQEVKTELPFTQDAWVYLPDHLHCLWTLPEGDSDYSKRWGLIKARFSKQAKGLMKENRGLGVSPGKKREAAIWQQRFWEHTIRDEHDLRRHLDYIHYNPLKHRLVERVEDWPHSSFHPLGKECILWIGEVESFYQMLKISENEKMFWGSDRAGIVHQFGR